MPATCRPRCLAAIPLLFAVTTLLNAQPQAPGRIPSRTILTEDFEGQGQAFAPDWSWETATVEQDVAVAHEGRASLRASAPPDIETFNLRSCDFDGVLGRNYRISFWIRADDRFPIAVESFPRAGGAHLHVTSFVTTPKWRKIAFGGRISGTYGFAGPAPVYLNWRVSTQKEPATVWIDDLRVEQAGDFASDAGWSVVAEGRNLVPNASFEVDPSRHYLQYQPHNDRGPDENFAFSEDAAFGSRSLVLQAGPDPAYHTPFRAGPTLELIQPLAFDSANEQFTLSASVKIGSGTPSRLTILLGTPPNDDVPFPDAAVRLDLNATDRWTRHHVTFTLPRNNDGKYFLYARGGENGRVLLDGLCLARGASQDFIPSHPIEATLSSDVPYRIYQPDDPLTFTLSAVRQTEEPAASLAVKLVDYRQRSIRTQLLAINADRLKLDEPSRSTITLDPLPRGCYRAELRVAGQPEVLSEICFAVIPQPAHVPFERSNYGVDVSVLFNTTDWDLSPMRQRLGFRWARVWSMSDIEDEAYAFVLRGMTAEQGRQAARAWLENLKRHGMGVYVSLHPQFKTHTTGAQPNPPQTDAQYAAYEAHARDLATRFHGLVDRWEIGNEPCLPGVSPENYARFVQTSVRLLREIDPDSRIVSLAGAADAERTWIERAIAAGALDHVDAIAFHYGGQTGSDTVARYQRWLQWARPRPGRPLEIWDSEESTPGPFFYPVRVISTTGLQDLSNPLEFPCQVTRGLKTYLCNAALDIPTIAFNAEYCVSSSGYARGLWERDGSLRPAVVANFLAAQMLQSAKGGGFYRTADGLFATLLSDRDTSVLALWSEKYTGTTQYRFYIDPFDMMDLSPRPVEELADIPDFYRDVQTISVDLPPGLTVLDTMTNPINPQGSRIDADIYPRYLVMPAGRESEVLEALGAQQVLKPN